MAIAKISHIRLIGLRRDQNKIIDALTSRGLFEARATDCVGKARSGDDGLCRELKLKQGRISFALDFLKARHAAMAAMLDGNRRAVESGAASPIEFTLSDEKYSGGRMLITKADFSDAAAREYELMHVCDELQKISFSISVRTIRSRWIIPITVLPSQSALPKTRVRAVLSFARQA